MKGTGSLGVKQFESKKNQDDFDEDNLIIIKDEVTQFIGSMNS